MKNFLALTLSLTFVLAQSLPVMAETAPVLVESQEVAEATEMPVTEVPAVAQVAVPKVMSGKIVEESDDQIKVQSYSGKEEIILNVTPDTYIIDSVKGTPVALADRIDDDVVVYYGPAQTKSMPPQSGAVAILCNIPQDYKVPAFSQVEVIEKGENQVVVTVDGGSLLVTITDEVEISSFKTKDMPTIGNIDVGTDLLLWYDTVALSYPAQTAATKVVILGQNDVEVTTPAVTAPTATSAPTKPTEPTEPVQTANPAGVSVVDADLPKGGTSDQIAKGANVTISGNLPEIKGSTDAINEANVKIVKIFSESFDKAGKNLKEGETGEVVFSYETFVNDNYTSIVIHTSISTGNSSSDDVDTIVLSNDGTAIVTLADVLGPNAYKIANQAISSEMKGAEEGMYNTEENAFSGLTSDPDFYVDENMNVIIVFDKYSIAPGSSGVPMFTISMDSVVNFEVSADQTYIKDDVTMVPLRSATEALGYEVGWNMEDQMVTITKGDAAHTLQIGTAQYDDRELEAAPELKDGVTYVPVSYFEVILGGCYLVTDDGVTISGLK